MNSTVVQDKEINPANLTGSQRGFLISVRFLTGLALCLWIGGMAFFGAMAAPVLFKLTKTSSAPALGPQMVGEMLARFGVLTTICALVLLITWLIDGILSSSKGQRLWKVQGLLSILCLGFSLYLSNVLLPHTQSQQAEILPIYVRKVLGEKLTPQQIAREAEFQKGHEAYKRIASLNLYLLLAIVAIVAARGVAEASSPRSASL